MSAYIHQPSGILITQAQAPEEWPPTPEHAPEVLLDLFSQHLIGLRDWVVRRAYETLVQRQPYAHGRIHQRPFTALDALQLSAEDRDKLVDVVAVFVDEAIEHTLSLLGARTNLVGEYNAAEYKAVAYELTAQVLRDERTAAERASASALATGDWQGYQVAEDQIEQEDQEFEDAEGGTADMPEDEAFPEASRIPIGRGAPLWFDYRKWLSKYCTFRRSARPSHFM